MILHAPVCLTFCQSLELVLRYFFYFLNFPSGSAWELVSKRSWVIISCVELVVAHDCHVGNVNVVNLFFDDFLLINRTNRWRLEFIQILFLDFFALSSRFNLTFFFLLFFEIYIMFGNRFSTWSSSQRSNLMYWRLKFSLLHLSRWKLHLKIHLRFIWLISRSNVRSRLLHNITKMNNRLLNRVCIRCHQNGVQLFILFHIFR